MASTQQCTGSKDKWYIMSTRYRAILSISGSLSRILPRSRGSYITVALCPTGSASINTARILPYTQQFKSLMNISANFDDCVCDNIDIKSIWRGAIRTTTSECQTSADLYMFDDAEVQTGISTEIVEDVVSKTSHGLSLLDFFCDHHNHRNRDQWDKEIRCGKVAVEGEKTLNPATLIDPEQYIEYVNIKSDIGTGISKMDFNCQTSDDILMSDRESDNMMGFLNRVLPLMEQELDANSSSTAFDGYMALREETSENIQLWNILTVDLEKHKVLYPDWSRGQHFPGVVTRCHVTRNKERIYDIELADGGGKLSGVREEYIRAVSNPTDSKSNRRREGKVRFYDGMRLHACVRASAKGSVRYLPGRVITTHRNGTADVECEGGVMKNGLTHEDVLVGLQEGQEVEARRPVLVSMQCTGVSWSCNGSIISASYGNRDVSGWCESPGAVCTWSIFHRDFNPAVPDLVLDHAICLMCVRFHPSSPSLVAAGSFNGEVLVWDLNHPDVPVAISPIAEDCHNEPVMSIDWVRDNASDNYLLGSIGADGKFLLWSLERGFTKPYRGSVLTKAKVSKRANYPSAHGGTSFSFSGGVTARRPKWVVLGQEGGTLVRAQAARVLLSGAESSNTDKRTVPLYPSIRKSGDTFHHDAHIGPVNCIQCSPFHRSLFITGGQDGAVRLYHMLEQSPLRSWEPSPPPEETNDADDIDTPFAAISCVCFSPTRPTVFAAASRDGHIYVFDLLVNQSGPVSNIKIPPVGTTMSSIIEAESNGRLLSGAVARATSLCFNAKQRDLIAACDQTGRVFIWKMGWSLSNSKQTEQHVLDRLGSVTIDDETVGVGPGIE